MAFIVQELLVIDIEKGSEARSDLIFLERTRRLLLAPLSSRRPLFPREPVESSPSKEFTVSMLRMLDAESKSSSESHSIAGKATTSSVKLRSNSAQDKDRSKAFLLLGAFTSCACFSASVAGHEAEL
eukprot:scaffold10199_cov146-Cylindrotheca_fusiformis.AAC.22